ncbi:hypothetical protein [Nonomuraea typhae]|uniref:hypothetical protein n=1 Tax=Nonomuraea typhae TaxID=2603600 RepID=UPI0012F8075B|nr:hypothetical protein [Nonomuraea typhae]
MTAASDYEDLHRLVDELTPDQVRVAHAQVLSLVRSQTEADDSDLPSWFGRYRAGRTDAAQATEEILREGYGQEH